MLVKFKLVSKFQMAAQIVAHIIRITERLRSTDWANSWLFSMVAVHVLNQVSSRQVGCCTKRTGKSRSVNSNFRFVNLEIICSLFNCFLFCFTLVICKFFHDYNLLATRTKERSFLKLSLNFLIASWLAQFWFTNWAFCCLWNTRSAKRMLAVLRNHRF